VYKKIWLPEGGDNEAAMHIVYRMRGLLGDATEEFIETLDAKTDQEVNNEEVYKMANVMADCRGLEVILYRLSTIEDLTRSRPLLQVLLKLLGLCVKVKHNQEVLTDPKLGSIPILLSTLELCLSNEADGLSNTVLTEQTLDVSINKLMTNLKITQNMFSIFFILKCTQTLSVQGSQILNVYFTSVLTVI